MEAKSASPALRIDSRGENAGALSARLLARIFGSIDLVAALLVALGVFAGLPARWWVVDLPAVAIVALLGASGVGLLARLRWGEKVARFASFVTLALGLALITALVVAASYLSGIYMAVGRGGALILVLVAALALPYLVVFPAAQLLWLGPARRSPPPGGTPGTSVEPA
jgi:hypothetical protein